MSTKALLVLCCALTFSCTARSPLVEPCFTPGGNCLSRVVAEIAKARTEVLVQTSSLSAKPVADALVRARQSNVNVEILLDKRSAASQNNAFYFANLNSVPTYMDGRHAAADSNFIIIDAETVIASSASFQKADTDRNAENLLIVRSENVASGYRATWQEHKAHAEVFTPEAASPEPAKQDPGPEKKRGKKKKKARTNP